MGLTKPYDLHRHGEGRVHLIECVNAARVPEARRQILERKFHRVYSKAKKRFVTVEKIFFYSDFKRHQYFLVRLPSERHRTKEANRELAKFMRDVPDLISPSEKQFAHVVFGLGDLREKLLAHDANLEEAALKKVKLYLASRHAEALKEMKGALLLERVAKDKLFFRAQRGKQQLDLGIPVKLVRTITGSGKAFTLNAQLPPSVKTLKDIARDLRRSGDVEQAAKFRAMLKGLPKGGLLPKAAQKDLEEIFNWAVRNNMHKLEAILFEIRFDTKLEKDWYRNRNAGDISRLWKLLKELPDSNVEGNTALDEIGLNAGGGGTFDSDTDDIMIGNEELSNPKRFADVLRHEVGHAVHEMNEKLVNTWLKKTFGWEMLDPTDRNIDKWVRMMGGWKGITTTEKQQVRKLIKVSLGKGESWEPPKYKLRLPARHPWFADNFGPRFAVANSEANWFETNTKWHRARGKAFFLNYWYGTLAVINADTIDLINRKMPDKYAAMSPLEFFAELYAVYFSHNKRQRQKLPRHVITWMNKNIRKMVLTDPAVKNLKGSLKDGSRGGRLAGAPQSGVNGARTGKSPQDGSRGGRVSASPRDGGRGG